MREGHKERRVQQLPRAPKRGQERGTGEREDWTRRGGRFGEDVKLKTKRPSSVGSALVTTAARHPAVPAKSYLAKHHISFHPLARPTTSPHQITTATSCHPPPPQNATENHVVSVRSVGSGHCLRLVFCRFSVPSRQMRNKADRNCGPLVTQIIQQIRRKRCASLRVRPGHVSSRLEAGGHIGLVILGRLLIEYRMLLCSTTTCNVWR